MNALLRSVPMLLAALLAIGTWYLADLQRRSYVDPKASSPTTPDFIVEHARTARLAPDGSVQTLLSADQLVHYLSEDRSVLDRPRVIDTRGDQPPVTITAETGETRNRLEEIVLTRDVHVVRAAAPKAEALDVRTERLVLRPDDDRASSDVEVHVTQGTSTLTGVGMVLDNAHRTLQVTSRVRATFAPRKKDAS